MITKKRLEKQKVLLFVPLLIIPFLALAFYAMGGGKSLKDGHSKSSAKGINTQLPDASFKNEEPTDKFGLYEQNGDKSADSVNGIKAVADRLGFGQQDSKTDDISRKLEELNREIAKPTPTSPRSGSSISSAQQTGMKSDVDRLEALMKTMQNGKGEDPEMAQLNGLMQNMLELQHPELVQQRFRLQKSLNPDSQFRAIPATLVGSYKVVQGATIKLKLQDTIRINGVFIPKGHEVFGTCRIANQRLLLDIRNIRLGTSIVPVDLSVYSLDGMEGIYAPEAMLTDALNGGTENAVRGVNLLGIDGSLGAQVTSAGIDAAKTLVSRKVSRIRVKLKAGQSILLRNNKPESFTKTIRP
ncbi:conjugative transposon protein TraM [Pedobacter sp. Du54]|uniref:conjugative transposon protein TraM n=1 Tax=Pedobacter anseongensis TaxID=3133439 RepID=UPI0030A459B2